MELFDKEINKLKQLTTLKFHEDVLKSPEQATQTAENNDDQSADFSVANADQVDEAGQRGTPSESKQA